MNNNIIQETSHVGNDVPDVVLYTETDCETCLRNKEQWTIRDMEEYTYKPQFTEHRLYTCSVCQKYICITFTGIDIIWEFIPKKEFTNTWNSFVQNKEHLEYIPKYM